METNVIYNEDCIEGMKKFPDECIDLIVTDCPYHIVSGGCTNIPRKDEPKGILNRRNVYRGKKGNWYNNETKHISLAGILNDSSQTTYVKEGKLFKFNDIEFKDWLPQVYRVLKQDSHCYIMINARNLKELQQEGEKVGFKFQQIIIWNKGNSTPNKYYLNSYEMILMLRKGKAKNIKNMGTKNILNIPNIKGNKLHPTEKPVGLMKILIENSSNENDIILDPFLGGGTTAIACAELNRRFIGFEIDKYYYDIAVERIQNYEK